jgi:aspartyl-tRNA synthetase
MNCIISASHNLHNECPKGIDAVLFSCDRADKAAKLAGAARLTIGNELGLSKIDVFEFCWIVDFPM